MYMYMGTFSNMQLFASIHILMKIIRIWTWAFLMLNKNNKYGSDFKHNSRLTLVKKFDSEEGIFRQLGGKTHNI